MKFKGIVIGILTAILAVNIFTAYTLIKGQKELKEITLTELKLARTQAMYSGEGITGLNANAIIEANDIISWYDTK